MAVQVVQAQRLGMADQLAQQSPPAGQVPDRLVGLVVDAGGDEAFQLGAAGIEDSQCRVPGARQLPGHLENLGKHSLRVQLGHQAAAHVEQPSQTTLIEVVTGRIHEALRHARPPECAGQGAGGTLMT